MHQHMFNVDGLRFINYLDDQSEFVAAYIEHRAFADQIGMRIIDFNLGEILPSRSPRPPVPIVKRLGSALMLVAKLFEPPVSDHIHGSMFA
jgi:hypothetical protein